MMEHRDNAGVDHLSELAFGTRPENELYDLRIEPGQLSNIAAQPSTAKQTIKMRERLMRHLAATGDPRALGKPAPWDFYPYYGRRVNENWSVDPRS